MLVSEKFIEEILFTLVNFNEKKQFLYLIVETFKSQKYYQRLFKESKGQKKISFLFTQPDFLNVAICDDPRSPSRRKIFETKSYEERLQIQKGICKENKKILFFSISSIHHSTLI